MKILVSLSLMLFFHFSLVAQSKEETKEWAKKLKNLSPLEYKELVESKDKLANENTTLHNTVSNLTNQIDEQENELEKLRNQANQVNETIETGEIDASPVTTNSSTGTRDNNATKFSNKDGIVFKVQIGAFRNKDLTKYFNNNKNFSGETDQDGLKKYTLGYFSEYWEADNFKKYLREMGVKDAWVVAYKGSKRLKMKDVLEGIIE